VRFEVIAATTITSRYDERLRTGSRPFGNGPNNRGHIALGNEGLSVLRTLICALNWQLGPADLSVSSPN
jgi:hypothetical protein